jgi:hypothetical protein
MYFSEYLKERQNDEKIIIYVISEKEYLDLLPDKAIRVYCYTDINTIKQRFSVRMKGNLPLPVASMLEKKHGLFEQEKYDLKFETTKNELNDICTEVLNYCNK